MTRKKNIWEIYDIQECCCLLLFDQVFKCISFIISLLSDKGFKTNENSTLNIITEHQHEKKS